MVANVQWFNFIENFICILHHLMILLIFPTLYVETQILEFVVSNVCAILEFNGIRIILIRPNKKVLFVGHFGFYQNL